MHVSVSLFAKCFGNKQKHPQGNIEREKGKREKEGKREREKERKREREKERKRERGKEGKREREKERKREREKERRRVAITGSAVERAGGLTMTHARARRR